MVSSTTGVQNATVPSSFTLTPSGSANSTNTIDSFAQQLATALEGYLNQSQNGSQLDITINPVQGQNSSGSQFLVTVTTENSATSTETAASAASNATTAAAESTSPMKTISTASGLISEVDAYWMQQPPAVQALRFMPNGPDKDALAAQLESEGYAIDNDIMVNGWDPEMTMTQRAAEGYTWVPSYGQSNVPVGPGISFPGLPSYDPSDPPPGSILVSTAFANGTEHNVLLGVSTATNS